jgi:hypothetical protein
VHPGKYYVIFGKTDTNAINLTQLNGDLKYAIDHLGDKNANIHDIYIDDISVFHMTSTFMTSVFFRHDIYIYDISVFHMTSTFKTVFFRHDIYIDDISVFHMTSTFMTSVFFRHDIYIDNISQCFR